MAESAKWYVVHTYSGYENTVAARPDPSGIHAPGVENADTPVTVSDLNGRVVYRGTLSGLRAVSLPHGYYIVLTADRAVKIRL